MAPYASATTEPSSSVAGYAPSRIDPPRSASPDTAAICSSIVAITGDGVASSNSVDDASGTPPRRAASSTAHCMPRHSPNSGIRCSRQWAIAPILPSMPRTPKPPGTTTASTPAKCSAAPSGVSHRSEATHFTAAFTPWAKPPARIASATDRYASGRSTYLPTSATVTSCSGSCTFSSNPPHSPQSMSRKGSPNRRTMNVSRCSS